MDKETPDRETNRIESVRPVTTLAEQDREELRRSSHLNVPLLGGLAFALALFAGVMIWVMGSKVPVPATPASGTEAVGDVGSGPVRGSLGGVGLALGRGAAESAIHDEAVQLVGECSKKQARFPEMEFTSVIVPAAQTTSRVTIDPSLASTPVGECLARRLRDEVLPRYTDQDSSAVIEIKRPAP